MDFHLTWFPSYQDVPPAINIDAALDDAIHYWTTWAGNCRYDGPYQSAVKRSLLVLRALTHYETGGIVAAPTTSLPEEFGGPRNWDYRYCWLRDASLTLEAMLTHGYESEALKWRNWLLRALAGDPEDLQIMYGVGGERDLTEKELPHLPGYQDAKTRSNRKRSRLPASGRRCGGGDGGTGEASPRRGQGGPFLLGPAARPAWISGQTLRRQRPGVVGDAGRTAVFHALPGHDVGSL